jgi:hypothetical protein
LNHHNDLVLAELDILDGALVAELTDALLLIVVPKEDFIIWKFRMLPAPDQCQDIASKKHLNHSDATVELY